MIRQKGKNDFVNIEKHILEEYESSALPQKVLNQLQQLEKTGNEIRLLGKEKKILSAKIGRKKKNNEDGTSLSEELFSLKENMAGLKAEQKRIRTDLVNFWQETSSPGFPERFNRDECENHLSTNEDITVQQVVPAQDKEIDTYVLSHANHSLYHLACWRNLITSRFQHKDISLIAKSGGGEIIGYLPLIHMQSRLFGNFAVSLPYFNYGGILSNNSLVEKKIFQKLGQEAESLKLEHVELREMISRNNLISKTEKVSMIRKLPETNEQLGNQLGAKLRAQINRARREEPEVNIGNNHDLLDDFYSVFARNMRDLGTPVYSKSFFDSVLRAWSKDSYIVCISLGKKPVAAAILLGFDGMLEIPWASAIKETNKSGINMYLYWSILNLAVEAGYVFFDFGRSSINSGTYKFKQQWGAEPLQNYWNYWLPEGHVLPQINPNNPKYRYLVSTWKRLPVWLTNLCGPGIVKNIP